MQNEMEGQTTYLFLFHTHRVVLIDLIVSLTFIPVYQPAF